MTRNWEDETHHVILPSIPTIISRRTTRYSPETTHTIPPRNKLRPVNSRLASHYFLALVSRLGLGTGGPSSIGVPRTQALYMGNLVPLLPDGAIRALFLLGFAGEGARHRSKNVQVEAGLKHAISGLHPR